MKQNILEGVNVFDFGWAIAGSLATKTLADFGATVVKLESATHVDFMRTNGFVKGTSSKDPNDKPFYSVLNTSKLGLGLNVKNENSKEVITEFYKWADVVFENFAPGKIDQMGLGYEYAKSVNPNIIFVHSSIYGMKGPLASQSGTDGLGSSVAAHRGMTGWPDREPRPFSPMVFGDVMLPLMTASTILAALDYRRRTGKSQELDLSMINLVSFKAAPQVVNFAVNGVSERRNGNHVLYAAPHFGYPCAGDDKWLAIAIYNDEEWLKFRKVLGEPEWAMDPKFETFEGRKENEDFLDEKISEWTKPQMAEQLECYLQSKGIPAALVANQQDMQDKDDMMNIREYYQIIPHEAWGTAKHMRMPFRLSKVKPNLKQGPVLGRDTYKACKLINMSDEQFVKYDQSGLFV